jgi:hypothetical protein
MRCHIRHLFVVEVLDDAGHDLIGTGAILKIVQLLVDREGRLSRHVRKLGAR